MYMQHLHLITIYIKFILIQLRHIRITNKNNILLYEIISNLLLNNQYLLDNEKTIIQTVNNGVVISLYLHTKI